MKGRPKGSKDKSEDAHENRSDSHKGNKSFYVQKVRSNCSQKRSNGDIRDNRGRPEMITKRGNGFKGDRIGIVIMIGNGRRCVKITGNVTGPLEKKETKARKILASAIELEIRNRTREALFDYGFKDKDLK